MAFKRCSIRSKGPKVCQENIPHTITPPPPAWTVETRQDGSMLSCSLRQILTLPSECRSRNRDSSDQATFFQSSIVQSWWTCANCILRFLFLADRSSTRCGLLLLQGLTCCAFRDGILHTLVVMSGHLSYCCLSSLTILPILLWPLTSTRPFHPHNCCSLDIFCFSHHSLYHSLWHQQTFHVQSHLNPLSSPFWCSVWTSSSRLHHI